MALRVTVVHGPEWASTRAALRKEERTMEARLQRAQRRMVQELAREAQLKVLVVQMSGGPTSHTGLRRRIADSVKVQHRGGLSNVTTQMKEPDERNLPLAVDRPQGWSHPFFGDRRIWYRQRALKPGWFTNTFDEADERVPDAMFEELQDSARRIDRAG